MAACSRRHFMHICMKKTFCSIHSASENLLFWSLLWCSNVWEIAFDWEKLVMILWQSFAVANHDQDCCCIIASGDQWVNVLVGKYQRPFQGEKRQMNGGGCVGSSMIFKHWDAVVVLCRYIWGLLCQKQVSRTGTSNYIPQYLWDVINCPFPWYLLLTYTSSYMKACGSSNIGLLSGVLVCEQSQLLTG